MIKNKLEENIKYLELSNKIINKLYKINILKTEDLWNCTTAYLKQNNISNSEIYDIKIKLQLIGLDLNKKNIQIISLNIFIYNLLYKCYNFI